MKPSISLGWFLLTCGALVATFHGTFSQWATLSLENERYSHLILIPALSAFLIYQERGRIFRLLQYTWAALGIVVAGVALYFVGLHYPAGPDSPGHLTFPMLALATIVAGAFEVFCGIKAASEAKFSLLLLFLMAPVPTHVLDAIVAWLQAGSAVVVELLFSALQVTFVRSGMQFDLPGLSIEIAEQCSGIRSSIALLVVTLILAHMTLRTSWRKLALVLLVVPLVLIKNGIRIVTLSLLAIHVDPRFLTGAPHHQGGFVFFGIALSVVLLAGQVLRRWEQPRKKPADMADREPASIKG